MGQIDDAMESVIALRILRKNKDPKAEIMEAVAAEMKTDVLGDSVKRIDKTDDKWEAKEEEMLAKNWTPMHPVWQDRKKRFDEKRKLFLKNSEHIVKRQEKEEDSW